MSRGRGGNTADCLKFTCGVRVWELGVLSEIIAHRTTAHIAYRSTALISIL